MKCLFGVVVCFFFSLASSAYEYFESLERHWAPKEEAFLKVKKAKQLTLEILDQALLDEKRFDADQRMLLARARVHFPLVELAIYSKEQSTADYGHAFYDWRFCWERPAVMTVEEENLKRPKACKRALFLDLQDLSQVLLHESFHLVEFFDECETTRMELRAMHSAGLSPHYNAYVRPCELWNEFEAEPRLASYSEDIFDFFTPSQLRFLRGLR